MGDCPNHMKVEAMREQCVVWVKSHGAELVWKSARIEVSDVTLPQTRIILAGRLNSGVDPHTTAVVGNINRAWQYLTDAVAYPLTLQDVENYNSIVGQGLELEPGRIRSVPVSISGTSYVPDIPNLSRIHDVLAHDGSPVDAAVGVFGSITRGQWFANGNKRTALMAANHQLIHAGAGVLQLPPERVDDEFRDVLIQWYETGDLSPLSTWLTTHAFTSVADIAAALSAEDNRGDLAAGLSRLEQPTDGDPERGIAE